MHAYMFKGMNKMLSTWRWIWKWLKDGKSKYIVYSYIIDHLLQTCYFQFNLITVEDLTQFSKANWDYFFLHVNIFHIFFNPASHEKIAKDICIGILVSLNLISLLDASFRTIYIYAYIYLPVYLFNKVKAVPVWREISVNTKL